MIVYELLQTERHKAYQELSIDNLERQYDFLRSIINTAVQLKKPMISTGIIKALNYHAIACLHVNAGEYRPCEVKVGGYDPPAYYRVPELMNIFVNEVNRIWQTTDAVLLSTFVLWKLNHIHPFINGNGRTARALCYFVVCLKSGGLLKGDPILPELIRKNRDEYVRLLKQADKDFFAGDDAFLQDLYNFNNRLINEQLSSIESSNE